MIHKTAAVWTYPDGREVCQKTSAGRLEYQSRIVEMIYRQKGLCALCGRLMIAPTFDHACGRGLGGGHRDDRIEIDGRPNNAAVCLMCNGAKGSRRIDYTLSK